MKKLKMTMKAEKNGDDNESRKKMELTIKAKKIKDDNEGQ